MHHDFYCYKKRSVQISGYTSEKKGFKYLWYQTIIKILKIIVFNKIILNANIAKKNFQHKENRKKVLAKTNNYINIDKSSMDP